MFDLSKFDYHLPKELIAQKPAVPRDASRLFVYNTSTDEIVFDRFYNLAKYLPKNSFMVFNNTKVMPARVVLKKQAGGKVICLLLINEIEAKTPLGCTKIKAMVDRKVHVGDRLYFPIESEFIDNKHFFTIIDQKEHIFGLKFDFSRQWLINKLIEVGKTPVPLYLRKTPLTEEELRKKYQTIFAEKMRGVISRSPDGWRKNMGSVAAPTASLHFSNRVFKSLDKTGVGRYFITLHVGMGTFAPITNENIKNKKLHEEYYEIDERTTQFINELKYKGKKLVAVGTTVTRTLESIDNKLKSQNSKVKTTSQKSKLFGKTDLFIMPPYHFKMVDCLITNFHLPKSSLMMMVEAFLQFKGAKRNLVDLYEIAIKERFRFYSFGDAMIII